MSIAALEAEKFRSRFVVMDENNQITAIRPECETIA